jgi:hypothetical protein
MTATRGRSFWLLFVLTRTFCRHDLQNSPIRDHLPIGSVILRVNGHSRLHTAADWYGAMARETAAAFTTNGSVKRFGYCTSVARVEETQAITTGALRYSLLRMHTRLDNELLQH